MAAANPFLTKTKAYSTPDGQVFTDRAEALKHAYALQVGEVAEQIVGLPYAEDARAFLLENAREIATLLIRATAKPKKIAEEAEAEPAEGEG